MYREPASFQMAFVAEILKSGGLGKLHQIRASGPNLNGFESRTSSRRELQEAEYCCSEWYDLAIELLDSPKLVMRASSSGEGD
jgi:hypothetical protein